MTTDSSARTYQGLRRGLLPLLVLLCGGVTVAFGQSKPAASRVWAGFALGYGSASGTCHLCQRGPARMGTTGSLSFGTGLSPRTLVGLEADVWSQRADGVREVLGTVSGVIRLYERPAHGWFVIAGAGVSTYTSWKPLYRGLGWGAVVGAGYDVSSFSGLSLSPVIKMNYGAVGDLNMDGVSFQSGWKQLVVDAGLQLRWNMHRRSAEPAP